MAATRNAQLLAKVAKDASKCSFAYGRTIINEPSVYYEAYNKLNLHQKYPDTSKLNVLELYPGGGLSSYVFNDIYSPRSQILMESKPSFNKIIDANLVANYNSIKLFPHDAYIWESFRELYTQTDIFDIKTQTRDHIHDEFMIMGNLTDKKGEQLYMQYLQCVANGNWLQRFGRVKMVFWVPQMTAIKVLAPAGSRYRARCSLLTECITDTRLIATSEEHISLFSSEIIKSHDPIILPPNSEPYALLEVNPIEHTLDIDNWEFVVQKLMSTKSTPLHTSIESLGHGAREYFVERIDPKLLNKAAVDLNTDEVAHIISHFMLWPFKPDILVDFYDGAEQQ